MNGTSTTSDDGATRGGPHGRFAGIPFDFRRPAGESFTNMWDPSDARLFVPRAFGAGWDVNFGAVGVKLGLVDPDADADAFESTPESAFRLAAAIPVATAAAVVLHYAVRGRSLPDELPSHWGLRGRADRWSPKGRAATGDIVRSLAVAGAAAAAALSSGDRASRASVLATTSLVATTAAAVTVWRSAPDEARWWAGPALAVASVGAAGVTLLGLAVAGKNAARN